MTDWIGITRRNARSVQTTIGWIFWDPGAVVRTEALGLPGPLGYIAARAAPLAPAGPAAVAAAFGSISPVGIALAMDLVERNTSFDAVWAARDEAVLEGLAQHAGDLLDPLARIGPQLWRVVEALPTDRPGDHAALGAARRAALDLVRGGVRAAVRTTARPRRRDGRTELPAGVAAPLTRPSRGPSRSAPSDRRPAPGRPRRPRCPRAGRSAGWPRRSGP